MESLEDIFAVLEKKPVDQLKSEELQLYTEVFIMKGQELMNANNLPEAKQYFQRVYDLVRSPTSMFLMGVSELRAKNDKEAEKWLKDAIEKLETDPVKVPNGWKMRVALGTVYMRPDTEDFEKATEQFTKAMKMSDEAKNANVQFNNGFALMKLGKEVEAKSSFEFVYQKDPSNWISAALLGVIVLNEKDYERAIEVFTTAIEASNGQADDSIYYNLAYAYMMLNKYKEAMENFNKAYELNPANAAAKQAAELMTAEHKAEEERLLQEEAEKEKERLEEEARIVKEKEAERLKQDAIDKEQKMIAEKAVKEAAQEKEEAEKQKEIKKREAIDRKKKRMEDLRMRVGDPQKYRARRPSLDLIPIGNTNKNAKAYVDWFNHSIMKNS